MIYHTSSLNDLIKRNPNIVQNNVRSSILNYNLNSDLSVNWLIGFSSFAIIQNEATLSDSLVLYFKLLINF
ncbi:MAG TPA: hypothetical protein DCR40_17895 [Prolixibacteraceae bacterium]|nr:hypothetical protein [Prolixibacteraceae bacterium]